MGDARCGYDHDCVHCCDCPTEERWQLRVFLEHVDEEKDTIFRQLFSYDISGPTAEEQERVIREFGRRVVGWDVESIEVESYRHKLHNRPHKDD